MTIKKKFISLISIISVVSLIFIVYVYLKNSQQTNVTTTLPSPNLQQNYKGSLNPTLSVSKDSFKYVNKLPLLEITPKTLTDNYARTVALNLGFLGEPTQLNDATEGITYFWQKGNITLFIYLKSAKIHYTAGISTTVVNKQLSDQSILVTTQDFLVQKEIFNSDFFNLNKVVFLAEDKLSDSFKETTKDKADLYQINIYPKSTQYEIITPHSTKNANYIQMTLDGEIYSFQLTVFGDVQNGITEYQLKNYDQIQSSLNKAILISIDGVETPFTDLATNTVQQINITNIDLAYLMDSTTTVVLQPVYKLTGTATLNTSNTSPVVLYLPALTSY